MRHGVTTVAVGSCSISAVLSDAEDCSDLFTRVESVPREHVLPLFREKKTWASAAEYVDFLRSHPLGANIVTFLGHSDLRTRVMGLARAVDPKARPTDDELAAMERHLEEALDQGFLALPVPFEVYADGIDLVVFEEFGAGQAALHLADEVARNELMKDEAYRRAFRKDYEARFTARVWQRDFFDAFIVACPDASVVGRSFGEVAKARGVHAVDAYLDLVVEHGKRLRWRTTINRSDGVVDAVFVNGRIAFEHGKPVPELGREGGFGTFLPAGAAPRAQAVTGSPATIADAA